MKNSQSSRSHFIFRIKVNYQNRQGNILFVDLAGSEKFNINGTAENNLETKNINLDLSNLSISLLNFKKQQKGKGKAQNFG